jgi:hypothetical protein
VREEFEDEDEDDDEDDCAANRGERTTGLAARAALSASAEIAGRAAQR